MYFGRIVMTATVFGEKGDDTEKLTDLFATLCQDFVAELSFFTFSSATPIPTEYQLTSPQPA